jgi:hypothetical protein
VLVYVDTPLEVCEQRDRKGLYAKARAGIVPQFTGVSDPYEPPAHAEVVVHSDRETVAESLARILEALAARGLVPASPAARPSGPAVASAGATAGAGAGAGPRAGGGEAAAP